eukprot:TRINITY_DN3473_c0_g1_i1.p1 TRINITY_DN3473_c0_g1~~TRINITY_DN3473_c0_g1_i1.p1  ORF type:complete len:350 (+),score=82.28 TRINITY_DN3473_c0_g1_i1:196-1245(+)
MSKNETYLVVGGGGFLGRYIVEQLLERGEKNVRVFDLRQTFSDDRIQFFTGDIRKASDVEVALKGVDCVFNTVSPPHGNKYELYYTVNVDGTKVLLEESAKAGVKKFIHTSSSSVVFAGKDLKGVNETQPYPKKHIDPYNYTKELAERAVIEDNGNNGLLTVALRPSGIFGPRDAQAWPAIIDVAKQGKWKYQFGDGKNLSDWTYVENVAQAHILAADKIKKGSGIDGEVFIITNDEPIPTFDMIKFAYKEMGFGEPYITIPLGIVWYASILIDIIVWLLSPFVTLHPNFTFFRIASASCYRYFDISKAKKVLGYKPKVPLKVGMQKTLQYFKNLENDKKSGNVKGKSH